VQEGIVVDNIEVFRKNGFDFDIDMVCGHEHSDKIHTYVHSTYMQKYIHS
jgi:hypothetical protein